MGWTWRLGSLLWFFCAFQVLTTCREDKSWYHRFSSSVLIYCYWVVILWPWDGSDLLGPPWMSTNGPWSCRKWYFYTRCITNFNSAFCMIILWAWCFSSIWSLFYFISDGGSVAVLLSWVASSICHVLMAIVNIWSRSYRRIAHHGSLGVSNCYPCASLEVAHWIGVVSSWSNTSECSTTLNNWWILCSNWNRLMCSTYWSPLRVFSRTRSHILCYSRPYQTVCPVLILDNIFWSLGKHGFVLVGSRPRSSSRSPALRVCNSWIKGMSFRSHIWIVPRVVTSSTSIDRVCRFDSLI